MPEYPLMVFCDFDGTITEKETLEGFLQLFLEEDITALGARMVRKGYTVKAGIQELMHRIPVEEYLAKRDYFQKLEFRAGFSEFLDFLQARSIPAVVISGGIREMVEWNLAPYREKILDVYSADVDLTGDRVRFWSDYETDTEMVGKREVMARYSFQRAVCIGDSYTDFLMAKRADVVFARDRLAAMMEKSGAPYFAFSTFYDIMDALTEILEGQR